MTSTPASQHLRDLARLRRVRDRIDREFAQPLDVEALARGVHMSAGHLSREFRRAYGESPYGYLMTRRIERAMALLRRGDLSVTEVCFAVGCSSLGTFSTRFAELVGMPPSTYRREAARATAGMPACVAKQVTRPTRPRRASEPRPGPATASHPHCRPGTYLALSAACRTASDGSRASVRRPEAAVVATADRQLHALPGHVTAPVDGTHAADPSPAARLAGQPAK